MNIFQKMKLSKLLTEDEIQDIISIQSVRKEKAVKKISEIVLRGTASSLDKDLRSYPADKVYLLTSDGASLFVSRRLNRLCLQWIKKEARVVVLFIGTKSSKVHVVDTTKYGE